MKEKDIYLIRHGQTVLNVERRALGQSDIGLTDEGVEEVKRLALHLKEQGVQPQRIYTSPLLRALRTAELLQSNLGGFIEEDEALREINYGAYEGVNRQGLREIEYGYSSLKMQEGQGETVEEVEQRIALFLHSILQTNDSSILIVTHAFVASVFTQLMLETPRNFAHIQPMATADYSYFKVQMDYEKGGDKLFVVAYDLNSFKEPLQITR